MPDSPSSATDTDVQLITACNACGSTRLSEFFSTDEVPVHVGILYSTREAAGRAKLGGISLCYCQDCGMVFNRRFDPGKLSFRPGYEVALHHSAVFRNYIQQLAQRLVDQYQLHEKDIVELGCGNGYFLELLCRLGNNRGTGIDPTVTEEGQRQLGEVQNGSGAAGEVRYIRDYFLPQHSDLPCDFACCLSVFEDVPQPVLFLGQVHALLSHRPNTATYFEVFNAFRAFEQRETWSVHYEQCNYFGQQNLVGLFRRSGFEVLSEGTCYEQDQYVFVEARPLPTKDHAAAVEGPVAEEIPAAITEFAAEHQRKCELWHSRLRRMVEEKQSAVLWGSGGKGISFANALPTRGVIEQIVDINPDRQGKFIPGSGQRIVPPESLVANPPDYIILTNVMYEQEIRRMVTDLGLHCEFWVA